MVVSAPMNIHQNGMQVALALPKPVDVPIPNVTGGLINNAAAITSKSIADQASHAKSAGVTMRGGRIIDVPQVAEGNSIPGVSFAANQAKLVGMADQLRAGSIYDGLVGSQPYKVGGGKHRRKTKKHVRRRRHRSNVRRSRKRIHHTRRSRHRK